MGMRSSLKPSDLTKQTGFGKQEGIARVDGARFKAIQHTKKDQSLVTPYLALQFDETYVGSDLKPIDESEPEQKDYILCWGDSKSLECKFRFQPANVKNAADQEPVEVGVSDIDGDEKFKMVEVDAEGNTFVSSDGAAPFENSDIGIFMAQLEKLGFKPEVLASAYAPDFVGMVYEFKTVEKKVLCEKLKIKYSPGPERKDQRGVVVVDMCREVTKILVRPYEKGAKGAVTSTKAVSGKPNGKAVEAPAESEGGLFTDTELDAIKQAVGTLKGTLTRKDFKSKVGVHIVKNKSIENYSKVGSMVSNKIGKLDDDGWSTMGLETGGLFSVDGDTVTIEA